jgi:hypothetical protein
MKEQLAAPDGAAQTRKQLHAPRGARVHFRLEESLAVAAIALRLDERKVGMLEQRRGTAFAGIQGDTEACRDRNASATSS